MNIRRLLAATMSIAALTAAGCSGEQPDATPTSVTGPTSIDDLVLLANTLHLNVQLRHSDYSVSFIVDGERNDDVMVGTIDWVEQTSNGTFGGIDYEWSVDTLTFAGIETNPQTPAVLEETARVIASLASTSPDNPVLLQNQGATLVATADTADGPINVYEYQSVRFHVDAVTGRLVRFEAFLPLSQKSAEITLTEPARTDTTGSSDTDPDTSVRPPATSGDPGASTTTAG